MATEELINRINNLPPEEREIYRRSIIMLDDVYKKIASFYDGYEEEPYEKLQERLRASEDYYDKNRYVSEETMSQPFNI